jgi:hypothetical protein
MDLCRGDRSNHNSHLLATAGLGGHIVLDEIICHHAPGGGGGGGGDKPGRKALYVVCIVSEGTGLGKPSASGGVDSSGGGGGGGDSSSSITEAGVTVNMVKFSPERDTLRVAAACSDGNCYVCVERRLRSWRRRSGGGRAAAVVSTRNWWRASPS